MCGHVAGAQQALGHGGCRWQHGIDVYATVVCTLCHYQRIFRVMGIYGYYGYAGELVGYGSLSQPLLDVIRYILQPLYPPWLLFQHP